MLHQLAGVPLLTFRINSPSYHHYRPISLKKEWGFRTRLFCLLPYRSIAFNLSIFRRWFPEVSQKLRLGSARSRACSPEDCRSDRWASPQQAGDPVPRERCRYPEAAACIPNCGCFHSGWLTFSQRRTRCCSLCCSSGQITRNEKEFRAEQKSREVATSARCRDAERSVCVPWDIWNLSFTKRTKSKTTEFYIYMKYSGKCKFMFRICWDFLSVVSSDVSFINTKNVQNVFACLINPSYIWMQHTHKTCSRLPRI